MAEVNLLRLPLILWFLISCMLTYIIGIWQIKEEDDAKDDLKLHIHMKQMRRRKRKREVCFQAFGFSVFLFGTQSVRLVWKSHRKYIFKFQFLDSKFTNEVLMLLS